ncbi:MAG TPA: BON domain-containing protein, partial [Vicinamibacterales bacterium]|nr:BON domain-containing protein [Vicinamibacterales bacterium]
MRSWFGDDKPRQRHQHTPHRDAPGRGNDERDDRFPYGSERHGGHDEWRSHPYPDLREDRGSRWEGIHPNPGPREDREHGYYASQAFGSYRTDDRPYHDRARGDRYRDDAYREREASRSGSGWNRPRYANGNDAAQAYFRAAREQREDFRRYEAQSPGAEFEDQDDGYNGPSSAMPSWSQRERGGYWRQYEGHAPYAGRGPKDYRRSDDRVREEICDCMTDDPLLDASEIVVQVSDGEVTLSGSVSSRDQKRRAEDVAERVSGVK